MCQQHMQVPSMRMRKNVGKDHTVAVGGPRTVRSLATKDKHSKICTAKGSRDRRIRLSANTAIQFYDVQDRLGFDRPSNAIDWLMKEAKAAIDVLNADQYHHLHELLVPDTASSVFNLSEAFHRTPVVPAFHRTLGDPTQVNLNHDQILGFNRSQFEIISSRNPIPVVQDTGFPNYNESEGFELGNMEPSVVNNLENQSYGLLGIDFEEGIQVQEAGVQEKDDGRRGYDRGYICFND